jgi:predicted AAA+ superfamily ATPase
MIDRIIKVPNSQSFFLFGPRQTGKTTYLKTKYKDAFWINLLDDGIFKQLLIRPNLLLEIVRARPIDQWIIIDEVQKIPELLNLVHMLIEERKQKFILTGSSARKLKSAGVNLLAGRAIDKKFHPLTAEELGENFNLKEAILYGQLPSLIGVESKRDALSAYVGMYLKEEIQQEALVRRLDQFARFLEVAAFSQAQVLSVLSIASDLGVSRNTAESYFQILEDLLLAYRIPVFKKRAKRKTSIHPKFYYFDVGIYRTLLKKGPLDPIEEIEGAAIESLVFQELKAYIDNHGLSLDIFFHRTKDKSEVDFVLYGEDGFFAIEVKRSTKINSFDLSSLKLFKKEYPEALAFVFYLGDDERMTDDQIHILPMRNALVNLKNILKFN